LSLRHWSSLVFICYLNMHAIPAWHACAPCLLACRIFAADYAVFAGVQVKEEYDSLRSEFFAGLQDVIYCDLPTSRAKAYKVRLPG
jgi:hypothetical protein